jgi:hypothetical protein
MGKTTGKRKALVPVEVRSTDLVSTFELAGCKWEVHLTDEMPTMMGYCDMERNQIKIRAGMMEQASSATFYHELVHAILFTMGKTQHDEEFVDGFANLLYQFQRTIVDVADGEE